MKQIIYNEEVSKKLREGVKKLNDAVSITFGPRGRNVAFDGKVVHDGITVAKEVELEDPFENMGAQIVREASSKTNDVAGDGTTTAVILANAIVDEGVKNITSGTNPMMLRKGLEIARDEVIRFIADETKQITSYDEKAQVASISAQSDSIGNIVAEAMDKVGDNGVITVDEGRGNNIELEYKEGMQFDKGYFSPYFATNSEKMEAVIDNPYILVTDMKVASIHDIVPLLDNLVKVSKDLVIICDEIEGEALSTLVVNKLRGVLNVLAVKAPGFGGNKKDILEDISLLIGANLISEEKGRKLDSIVIEDLGRADKVIASKDETTIVGGKGDVKDRISAISKQLKTTDNEYEKEKLKERLAKLSSGVAVINVGAPTEAELKELKLRVEDAVSATKAAVEEGIVPGGGITFLHAREYIKDLELDKEEKVGADILYKALEEPIKKLLLNSGADIEVLGEIKKSKGIGLNVVTMKLSNMIEDGVIDPAKVLRSALENAVSSAIMILTTGCVIVTKEEDDKDRNQRDY